MEHQEINDNFDRSEIDTPSQTQSSNNREQHGDNGPQQATVKALQQKVQDLTTQNNNLKQDKDSPSMQTIGFSACIAFIMGILATNAVKFLFTPSNEPVKDNEQDQEDKLSV